ncbi:P40 [Urbanus proteus nucleopolyhedrovirus]|uniref:P40 n=1 Tax=Urbanus proteus nucleopolyhedrovirus TaxID=1675866 RepID=A0A162GUX2_9ABAC|nr:P40 [Urbanus proteus nucleopolyhedrovirus]AKR17377.1 P40 [Urbanus proteus nucleopolyhedrovirus]
MSDVLLFLQIEKLKNKIDPTMRMDVWSKFFVLLADPNATLQWSSDEFVEFLTTVAQLSVANSRETNATLASQFTSGIYDQIDSTNAVNPPRKIFNIFNNNEIAKTNTKTLKTLTTYHDHYKKVCKKLLQQYTLMSTSSTEFKIGDLVACIIYLMLNQSLNGLFKLLEPADNQTQCIPNYTSEELYNLTELLRVVIEMPSVIIDENNIKNLKLTFNKIYDYPISRFPRIIYLNNDNLNKDKQCTIEEIITERADFISRQHSQQLIKENTKIPSCDDDDLINELINVTSDFSVQRMFYNAANSIFYTTMNNFASSNCYFNVDDYNNIYKSLDVIKSVSENLCEDTTNSIQSEALTYYLNNRPMLNSKRAKKY